MRWSTAIVRPRRRVTGSLRLVGNIRRRRLRSIRVGRGLWIILHQRPPRQPALTSRSFRIFDTWSASTIHDRIGQGAAFLLFFRGGLRHSGTASYLSMQSMKASSHAGPPHARNCVSHSRVSARAPPAATVIISATRVHSRSSSDRVEVGGMERDDDIVLACTVTSSS